MPGRTGTKKPSDKQSPTTGAHTPKKSNNSKIKRKGKDEQETWGKPASRRGGGRKKASRMAVRRGPKTKSKPVKKSVKTKKTKGKKKLNAYMLALQKARNENAPEFKYNGKTYKQKKTKTGMIIYAKK
jgi:hypothetical protein